MPTISNVILEKSAKDKDILDGMMIEIDTTLTRYKTDTIEQRKEILDNYHTIFDSLETPYTYFIEEGKLLDECIANLLYTRKQMSKGVKKIDEMKTVINTVKQS